MANGNEQSNRKSARRSKGKRKVKTPTREPARERTNTIPRLDKPEPTMERVPSNAPTMVIAPSDYEHIFHEGAGGNAVVGTVDQQSPPPNRNTPPPPPVHSPPPARAPPRQSAEQEGYAAAPPPTHVGPHLYAADMLVTPDGYTLLGHEPDLRAGRRVALPPHVVRASNQFSRAALMRISRYLASRADPPR